MVGKDDISTLPVCESFFESTEVKVNTGGGNVAKMFMLWWFTCLLCKYMWGLLWVVITVTLNLSSFQTDQIFRCLFTNPDPIEQ